MTLQSGAVCTLKNRGLEPIATLAFIDVNEPIIIVSRASTFDIDGVRNERHLKGNYFVQYINKLGCSAIGYVDGVYLKQYAFEKAQNIL